MNTDDYNSIAHDSLIFGRAYMDEWIKKMSCLYTMQYYCAIKKGELESWEGNWTHLGIIL